ncbi:MAG: type I methionyl aminopeptidase [Syntrophomonadaceae bacterium]
MNQDIQSVQLSRNDHCWCGSGKKYKKCHLDQDERLEAMEIAGCPVPSRDLIKTDAQIEGIRKACRLSNDILDMVATRIGAGIITKDIDRWVYEYTVAHGAIPASLNYQGYPCSVCTSINQVVCHGIPDETFLQDGDIVNVDVTTILDGYYGDVSRMFMVGAPSREARDLVRVARECMYIGIEQVKPFNRIGDIAFAIEQHANQHGYSVVQDYGGHGVGLAFHEEPFVQHYGERENGMVLVPNMVFTVEPMINMGSYHCKRLGDGWTAVTRDGLLSAQWEHTVRVTEYGVDILSE